MSFTRREFGKAALAGIPAAGALLSADPAFAAVQALKANSKWAGVQVGLNVPYSFGGGNVVPAQELLTRCLQVGVSALELRAQPVELFMGSPALMAQAAQAAEAARTGGAGRAGGGGGRGGGRGAAAAAAGTAEAPAGAAAAPGAGGAAAAGAPPAGAARGGARAGGGGGRGAGPTPEQLAANEANRKWRLSAPMSKAREFRKLYEDAGVLIEIVKVDGLFGFPDDETDYFFELAKTLGARAISGEISTPTAGTKRIGQFADKHKMMVGYHGHTETGPIEWLEAFSYAKYNAANLDIGHYVAGHDTSPVPFMLAHHDRITHIHVKDRKNKTNGGANVPFGAGDTPIKQVLQLIRDNKWKIQATIEFEYAVPPGSDRMAEIKKSVEFCKTVLLG